MTDTAAQLARLARFNMRQVTTKSGKASTDLWDLGWDADHTWHMTIRGLDYSIPYGTGSAITSAPHPGDILQCLIMDETEDDFWGWARDLGLTPFADQQTFERAESSHHACRHLIPSVLRDIFGDDLDHARRIAYRDWD